MEQTYLLWVKPDDPAIDIQSLESSLCEIAGVEGAEISPLPALGANKKEVVMAVSLSVTANFLYDGLKVVFNKITEEGNAEVVYCRRPDGEEVPVDQLTDSNTADTKTIK